MFVIKHKVSNRFLFGNSTFSEFKFARKFNSFADAENFLNELPQSNKNFQILPLCRRCEIVMQEGQALQNEVIIFADFVGDEPNLTYRGATCAPIGKAVMIKVWKCRECGHSLKK